ncbi:MAG: fatty acid desaturase [Saprospiraceae bacterium]|nr:fatty acid desaturase [Saprospiraceae bacterium]
MAHNTDFQHSSQEEPHIQRTKDIIRKYPEIKKLMGKNPNTFWWALLIVSGQLGIAFLLRDQAWWVVLIAAYLVGAFANHALFVLIHEFTHNMVFKSRIANLWGGIMCDIPNAFPSSVSFRKYHLKHHAFQGHYDIDADLPSRWEARLIGSNFIGKSIWLLLFPLFQALRPPRLKEIQFNSAWVWMNLITVMGVNVLLFIFVGPMALVYMVASFFFSVGLHPLGARWIQEHYLVAAPQETYSYYGPLNKLAFNVGYHNEHHDFSYIPWNNLPKVREIASDYYDTLYYHTSWSKLLLKFLFDKELSLFSRVTRDDRGGINVSSSSENDFFKGMEKKEGLTAV